METLAATQCSEGNPSQSPSVQIHRTMMNLTAAGHGGDHRGGPCSEAVGTRCRRVLSVLLYFAGGFLYFSIWCLQE